LLLELAARMLTTLAEEVSAKLRGRSVVRDNELGSEGCPKARENIRTSSRRSENWQSQFSSKRLTCSLLQDRSLTRMTSRSKLSAGSSPKVEPADNNKTKYRD